jgi:uncharacterized GH25 family protein
MRSGKNKRIIVLIIVLVSSLIVHAHEFWIQPDKYVYNIGDKLSIAFKVGENFLGEPWDLKKNRIEKIELHNSQKSKNLATSVKTDEKENLSIPLTEEGTHLLVMESNNAFIELEAEKFNTYLEEDGHDEAIAYREKNNRTSQSAKELYSRHAKLLVQVGAVRDDTFKKRVGLPIEIIPDQNPYSLKVGAPIKFRIFFQGKPLFGAKVKVWNFYNNRTTTQNIYSQQDGWIETRISTPGRWMVSVVKMVPSKDKQADWQSYWGSLVFGIK